MTREHRAWEMLIRRLDYLNGFGGNRSEMEKTTRIVAQIWDDAGHEAEPLAPRKTIQKKRGRKRPTEVFQACSNCHYSKPVEGKPGLVQCTKRTPAQKRAPDSWCFAYKSVADAKAEAETELALRNRIMQGV